MKGIYNKNAIQSVVDPLKAISSVFNNKSVHVVYENSDDDMFISVVNKNRSIYAMYELTVNDVIKNYSPEIKEIPIWDVKQFIDILSKYQNDVYIEDLEIDCKDGDNKIVISCGKDTTDFYMGQLHLFEDIRSKSRKLKTELLTEACGFSLNGDNLKKLITNICVFVDQDEITFSGIKGENEVTVKLSASSGTVFNKNESVLENVTVMEDFELKFPKDDIKGLLACNDQFYFSVYTGKKNIIGVEYERDNYEMKFYFSPLVN